MRLCQRHPSTNWQEPGAKSPGSKLRRLRHHRPSSTHNCESSRAPKNQLAQNCDCRKMLKIQRARRNNVLKHLLCTLLTVCMPSYRQRREHSARCRSTSKTSKKHATAVVDDERGHFIIGMGTRRKEQDENQPQDPESTPSCRNSYKFFHKPPWISRTCIHSRTKHCANTKQRTGSARYKGLITERPISKCMENRNHSKAPRN